MTGSLHRRAFVRSAAACVVGLCASSVPATARQPLLARVILDNDFAGDPDGLFQLAHHVLCRSTQIPLIIGSHLPAAFGSGHDARDSTTSARELLALMGRAGKHTLVAGSEVPIRSSTSWQPGEASRAIVREAMRTDVTTPLVYAAGAGLTDLALAWLSEPGIGKRLRLIWIGGRAPLPPAQVGPAVTGPEFNFMIDPVAAQVIFNQSDIEIWQVPSSSYEQMLFSTAELEDVGASGPLGAYLKAKVDAVPEMFAKLPGVPEVPLTDAYVLGDSPLVTLTALVPPMHPEPTSCRFTSIPTPRLMDDGTYRDVPGGRPMRVYTQIDAGLTFRDMLARFRHLAAVPG